MFNPSESISFFSAVSSFELKCIRSVPSRSTSFVTVRSFCKCERSVCIDATFSRTLSTLLSEITLIRSFVEIYSRHFSISILFLICCFHLPVLWKRKVQSSSLSIVERSVIVIYRRWFIFICYCYWNKALFVYNCEISAELVHFCFLWYSLSVTLLPLSFVQTHSCIVRTTPIRLCCSQDMCWLLNE